MSLESGQTEVVLVDSSGNPLSITGGKLDVDTGVVSVSDVKIADGGGSGRLATVDTANRLLVSTPPPVAPPGTTAINQTISHTGPGKTDDVFVIPTGQALTIQRFAGGAEGGRTKQSRCTLFFDPAGNGLGMTIIRRGYVSGNNFDFALNGTSVGGVPLTGDGTMAIRMRAERLDGGGRDIDCFWDGFTA